MKLTGNLTLLASLGMAGALTPSCAPGGNFDLSKWELQLPIGNGSPQIVEPDQLVGCSGYQDPGHHYFFTESGDGALVMKAPGTPAKTGCVKFAESDHCRTELGEKATWSPNTGTNRLFAELVGTNVHNICIGQVFQADSGFNKPFAELYYSSDGKIQFGTAKAAAGGAGQDLQLLGTVPVNTRFTYEVRFEGGQLLARINNNAFTTLRTYFTTPKAFFKAGNYNQDLTTTDTADLHFFQLTITH
ncbi:polysaccharide lyase family 7 protein [Xylaria arbuscula]|nr:polysaccharide lyase family 7 protein [Xylaria arbuscula]